jgi:hypothetical protein
MMRRGDAQPTHLVIYGSGSGSAVASLNLSPPTFLAMSTACFWAAPLTTDAIAAQSHVRQYVTPTTCEIN